MSQSVTLANAAKIMIERGHSDVTLLESTASLVRDDEEKCARAKLQLTNEIKSLFSPIEKDGEQYRLKVL